MKNEAKIKNRWWLRYVVMAGVMIVFTLLIAWLQKAFVIKDAKALFVVLSNAFFAPGMITFLVGLSAAIKSGVLFVPLINACKKLFQLLKQDRIDRKYRNFGKYNRAMREPKPTAWFMVLDGALFVAIGGAFHFAYLAA